MCWFPTQTTSDPGVLLRPGQVDVDSIMLDVEDTFCFLNYILCSGGGCDSAIATRCCHCHILPVLTTWYLSSKVDGKVYGTCVPLAMLHHSETWGLNVSDLQRPIQVHYFRNMALGISHCWQLRWYGHVQRVSFCINYVTDLAIPATRWWGRHRQTCKCV